MDHPSHPLSFELKDSRSNFPFTRGGIIPADSVFWYVCEFLNVSQAQSRHHDLAFHQWSSYF